MKSELPPPEPSKESGSCAVCPDNGPCVLVTPARELGLHESESRLMHALLARRLRTHPPAGAPQFSRELERCLGVVEDLRRRVDYDPSRWRDLLPDVYQGPDAGWGQPPLERFIPMAACASESTA